MGLKIEYPEGATPLDPDYAEGLTPTHITTVGQLNEWEFLNVSKGEEWAFRTPRREVLAASFVETLHEKMFGDTWRWAGRKSDLSALRAAGQGDYHPLFALLG